MKRVFYSLLATLCLAGSASANNILVSNATLTAQNTAAHYTRVGFDISWENSWRTSNNESNYDGAWVFVKFRKNGTLEWRHATLNSANGTTAAGAAITVPSDGKGLFIYRNADGIGNVNFTGNTVRWDYGADGVLDNETVEIRVFAVEMVYVPTGSFYLGSGGTETNCFKTGATSNPYLVTSASITWGTAGSDLNSNGYGQTSGTLAAAFPTGYNAFWMMKYEISQQQYADFLNHLDLARATVNNTPGIFTGTHPNLVAPQPERIIGSISPGRFAALADWSGLRPATEMEFEKASRGYNITPLPNEFVWGSTTNVNLTSVTNQGLVNETVSAPLNANAALASSYPSPVRAGLFARSSGATRELSGASYYGILNLGDNISEMVITAGNTTGLAFSGAIHGDGFLAADGNSNISTWTNFAAFGTRGSSYNGTVTSARISDRSGAPLFQQIYGYDAAVSNVGGRFVRTAP